jgi:hypothetical protein
LNGVLDPLESENDRDLEDDVVEESRCSNKSVVDSISPDSDSDSTLESSLGNMGIEVYVSPNLVTKESSM